MINVPKRLVAVRRVAWRVARWAGVLASAVTLLAAAGLLLAVVPVFGNRALIVRSGSMSPALGVGDLVIVRPPSAKAAGDKAAYEVGDVIAFRGARSEVVVTHRVAEVQQEGGRVQYVTKGDANNAPDEGIVTADRVLGRKIARVPYAGWLLSFGKTKFGFVAFIVLPALLVMAGDVRAIWREVRSKRGAVRARAAFPVRGEGRGLSLVPESGARREYTGELRITHALAREVRERSASEERPRAPGPARVWRVLPPRYYVDSVMMKVLLLMFSVGLTVPSGLAFYTDTEASAGNSFTVAESFVADHVVISEVQVRGTSTLNDFVELYNPTGEAVDLGGWKLRKKSSTGTESSVIVFAEGASISAHSFFLWANSLEGYAESLAADASTTQTLAPDNSVVFKTGGDEVVDQVAWGSGGGMQFVERAPFAQNPGQHQSIERKARQGSTAAALGPGGGEELAGNGWDADRNAFDFVLRGESKPQSRSSDPEEL